jgi:transposase-like protein
MNAPPRRSCRRAGGFQPPHCPNPECPYHRPRPDWHFVRNGRRRRRRDGRRIQDFRCRHCGRYFSTATFSVRYWLRRPELLIPCAKLVTEGAGLRQTARSLGTTHTTVARHIARLARHAWLFHRQVLKGAALHEPLVADGFESFVFSQYHPFHANLAVGARSWFLYHFTHAALRRKGAMTAAQRRKRAARERDQGRPDPKAVELAMAALLDPLVTLLPPGAALELHTDDHPAYPRSLARLRRARPDCPQILHRVTSARKRRTQKNPLFPVNLADLLLRHGSANHRRETIAFSKRLRAALERLAVFLVWRNYVKKRREKATGPEQTAAMAAGVCKQPLAWRQVLRRRLFPQHVQLPAPWAAYYEQRVKTVARGMVELRRECRYAI